MPEPIIENPQVPTEPEAIETPETPEVKTPEVPETPETPEEKIDAPEEPSLNEVAETPDSGEELEYDPYDAESVKAYIKAQTAKNTAPVADQLTETRITNQLTDILSAHPEYAPYKERITKWVNHPNRKGLIKSGLPVSTVVTEAIAPYLQRIGAQKAKEADSAAQKTKSVGTTTTPKTPSSPDYKSMGKEEIEKLSNQVKAGRYKQ